MGLNRTALIVGLFLAVPGFMVGAAAHKAYVTPSIYLIPGAGNGLEKEFGIDDAKGFSELLLTPKENVAGKTGPFSLSISTKRDSVVRQWVFVGILTALGVFLATVIAVYVGSGVLALLRGGGDESSDDVVSFKIRS